MFPSGVGARASNPLATAARRRREVFESRKDAYERYASRAPFAGVDPDVLRAYVDFGFADQADGTVILKCRGEIEARTYEASGTGAVGRLGEISSPFTIAGSGDGGPPAQIARDVASRLPKGRFEYYGDLTHFGPLEAPEQVSQAIVAALDCV